MLKQVYEIDEKGFRKELYIGAIGGNGKIIELLGAKLDDVNGELIIVDPPHGLIKAKWNGTEWVEGESEEELSNREALKHIESLKPTGQELADADLEIKVLSLLLEMGVV